MSCFFFGSLCIDAFLLEQPLITLFHRARIHINSSLIVSGGCWCFFNFPQLKQLWSLKYGSSACRFIGTSGQNIDDLYKYSDAKDKLEFVERTLRWRHLAPTAPNSLGNSSGISAPLCYAVIAW